VEMLRYAFPPHRGTKQWDVVGLGRISVGEDGSLSCELLWAPTTVLVKGALLERAEVVVERDLGTETWGNGSSCRGRLADTAVGDEGILRGRSDRCCYCDDEVDEDDIEESLKDSVQDES
jgi:hypothetical protein